MALIWSVVDPESNMEPSDTKFLVLSIINALSSVKYLYRMTKDASS